MKKHFLFIFDAKKILIFRYLEVNKKEIKDLIAQLVVNTTKIPKSGSLSVPHPRHI